MLIAAAETSKLAWYILGGVLTLYAVVLAGIGLRRPDFPFHARGQSIVIAVSFVLIVLAIGASIATA